MARREFRSICAVVAIGLLTALLIIFRSSGPSDSGHGDSHGHGHGHGDGHDHGDDKGPNGGRMLREGDFGVELLLDERGASPHFRVYCYDKGRKIDPKEVKVAVQLKRLGDKLTKLEFMPERDFLFSAETIDQPHSFWIRVEAEWKGEPFEWEYPQTEDRLGLSSELAKSMGISTEEAGPGVMASTFFLPGEIAMNADRVSHVVPRVSGCALSALKNLGDYVHRDETLAIIDSRELGEARSRYLVALEREKLSRYNFERSERLWEKATIPEKEHLTAQKNYLEEKIESAATRRKLITMGLIDSDVANLQSGDLSELTQYVIRSPFDGVVVKKHLSPGEWVKEDTEIYVIADLSDVWVEITVYAKDINDVFVGQKAVIRAAAPGLTESGTVSYVGPIVGEESRTARARVVLPNRDGKWKPGLFATVELTREELTAPLVVKTDAIQKYKNSQVVFVRHDDEYEPRFLTLGRTDGRLTEVLKGLSVGDTYVVDNSFILKSELGKMGMSHQH